MKFPLDPSDIDAGIRFDITLSDSGLRNTDGQNHFFFILGKAAGIAFLYNRCEQVIMGSGMGAKYPDPVRILQEYSL